MVERFYNELGRMIGTDANPQFWADNFGMAKEGAARIIETLKASGRAVERNGLLYRAY